MFAMDVIFSNSRPYIMEFNHDPGISVETSNTDRDMINDMIDLLFYNKKGNWEKCLF